MKNFIRYWAFGVMILLWGCSESSPPSPGHAEVRERYPADLALMQGYWRSEENEPDCSVHIEGYTVRLNYEDQDHDIHYKRNACISAVDESHASLAVHGDKESWFYVVQREKDHMELELRLFNATRQEWLHTDLIQTLPLHQLAER